MSRQWDLKFLVVDHEFILQDAAELIKTFYHRLPRFDHAVLNTFIH